MQKVIFFAFALTAIAAGNTASAQLNIGDNAVIYLQEGAVLSIQGDLSSTTDIAGQGTVLLNGWSQQHLAINGHTVANLQLDNTAGAVLDNDLHIGSRLIFTNGRISVHSGDLYMEGAAGITGYDRSRYIITDGTGRLIRNALTDAGFTFPIGSDDGRYHPLTLTQGGEVHAIGVRAFPGSLSDRGIPPGSANIAVNWEVTDITPGSDNLSMVASWQPGDEPSGFDPAHAAISLYEEGKGWSMAGVEHPGPGDESAMAIGITRTGLFSIAAARIAVGGPDAITIFPDPAVSGFYVHLPAKPSGVYTLNLFDLHGRLIVAREITGGSAGDYFFDPGTKGAAPVAGAYLLEVIYDGSRLATEKIVLIRP